MANVIEQLQKIKGKRVRLVYEFDRWDKAQDGARFSREEYSRNGVLKEVFDDHWILVDANLVNLAFIKEVRQEA